MSDLFLRTGKLIVGSSEFLYPDFHMQYEVSFDDDEIPNEGIIYIYNINKDSRSRIKEGEPLVFDAGYEGDMGTIFSGVVTNAHSYREGPDRITKIKGLSVTNQYLDSKIAKTYNAGVTSEYLVNDMLKLIGLTPNMIKLDNNLTYQRGYAAFGKTIDILRKVVKDAGSKVIINNSNISILPDKKGIETGFKLNAKTGLLSVDPIDDPRSISQYRLKMLLNHAINSRSLLEVESDELNATVLVIEGMHINWQTQVEVRVL